MRKISILGSTGSIGTQTLEVVENLGDIRVAAITGNKNIALLEKQARKFHPELIASRFLPRKGPPEAVSRIREMRLSAFPCKD